MNLYKFFNSSSFSKILVVLFILSFSFSSLTPVFAENVNGSTIASAVTLFKKNETLKEDEELALVRKHLVDNKLPQEIIDRVDQHKTARDTASQKPGIFTQAANFVTGNTDAQKEKAAVEELAKKQPFKVKTSDGKINTARADSYSKNFSGGQEESGGLLEKMRNFFKNGTLKNLDVNDAKNTAPVSWLLGKEVFAASDNPSDYLAAGNEIIFSKAIKDKADALNHDPLSIFNFIRNNITYVPYYGSKKGSDATLVEQAGNDTDKAALMIAMLRYSNIPTRYRQADVKMDIGTVTDLLGVHSATAAAQVLGLEKIPYILYTDNSDNPLFFVLEHTYVEAYIPYGYSRGADMNDGGESQWVPMDASMNAYYYEQPVDILGQMKTHGFQTEQFFDDYLNAGSSALEPIAAFKAKVTAELAAYPPTYYPNMTYGDALMKVYPKNQNLTLIPGTLPYEVAADLDTYAYVPTSLRHSISFNVKNDQNTTTLSYTGFVSDFADKELLMSYDPATQADQDTLNTFATIYDVVPLSLVHVKPTIKAGGVTVATGNSSSALGLAQTYKMEFNMPTRDIGGSITSYIAETVDRNVITGNTDAIALNTDRIVPPELRPAEDTQTSSFVANQKLYKTGIDFLSRLQQNQIELARITGGDFTNIATRAMIFNGIQITYSGNIPYSFSWKGLRIDASSTVNYFNRVNTNPTTHFKDFVALFGLQASQEESNIFENDFNVTSVATVKGLKLVSANTFPGITLKKITSINESIIDTMNISQTMKSVFHTAVQNGDTIYSPSGQITYGTWTGLFYININFAGGTAGYIIGEGLNGGFSVCGIPGAYNLVCNWTQTFFNLLVTQSQTTGITSTITASPTTVVVGNPISIVIHYTKGTATWTDNLTYYPTQVGQIQISPQYNPTTSVTITITASSVLIGSIYNQYDALIVKYEDKFSIPRGVLKSIINKETGTSPFQPNQYKYEPGFDYDNFSKGTLAPYSIYEHPYKHFTIRGTDNIGRMIIRGDELNNLFPDYTEIVKGKPTGWAFRGLKGYTGNETFAQLLALDTAPGSQNWLKTVNSSHPIQDPANRLFTAQTILSSSYGLGQVMYLSAITLAQNSIEGLWFDTSTSGAARSVYDMNDPETAIHLAASVLRYKYEHTTTKPDDAGKCGGWGNAVRGYNGLPAYRDNVCADYYDKLYKPKP